MICLNRNLTVKDNGFFYIPRFNFSFQMLFYVHTISVLEIESEI